MHQCTVGSCRIVNYIGCIKVVVFDRKEEEEEEKKMRSIALKLASGEIYAKTNFT